MGTTKQYQSRSIKVWAEDDRPREKMIRKGRTVLSDAELLAILLGSGSRDQSAVELARTMLASCDNDLNKLSRIPLKELMEFKGVGEAKAVTIAAAVELGRRRSVSPEKLIEAISSSHDAYNILYPLLADLNHEEFYVVILNRANRVIDVIRLSQGGVSGTVADVKLIFKHTLDKLGSAIIVAHNHPSGNLTPSQSDISLTLSLKKAGELLDIAILDHLIIAGQSYTSLADDGMI